MKKKILLLVPPNFEKLIMERSKEVNDAFGTYPPLGLMYIATYILQELKDKIELEIVDTSIGHWNKETFTEKIKSFKPDIVGITAFTPSILDVIDSLKLIKAIYPNCITVLGGPHVSSFGADSMCYPEMDFGVMGYGEYSFLKLIEALFFNGNLADVPGLIYRDQSKIVINPMNNDAVNLDSLPIPDRSLIPYKMYRCPVGTQTVMATVVSSRGCPFQCTFCNSPDKKHKMRSIDNVIQEVEYLVGLGIKEIFFFDDLFNLTNQRVFEFCDLLKKKNINITWAFKSRVTNITDELIKTVKNCGCERIHFGIETHTDESLKRLKKGITVEQIKNAVALCHKYKINTVGSFMINLPGDTKEDIFARFKFANSLKLE